MNINTNLNHLLEEYHHIGNKSGPMAAQEFAIFVFEETLESVQRNFGRKNAQTTTENLQACAIMYPFINEHLQLRSLLSLYKSIPPDLSLPVIEKILQNNKNKRIQQVITSQSLFYLLDNTLVKPYFCLWSVDQNQEMTTLDHLSLWELVKKYDHANLSSENKSQTIKIILKKDHSLLPVLMKGFDLSHVKDLSFSLAPTLYFDHFISSDFLNETKEKHPKDIYNGHVIYFFQSFVSLIESEEEDECMLNQQQKKQRVVKILDQLEEHFIEKDLDQKDVNKLKVVDKIATLHNLFSPHWEDIFNHPFLRKYKSKIIPQAMIINEAKNFKHDCLDKINNLLSIDEKSQIVNFYTMKNHQKKKAFEEDRIVFFKSFINTINDASEREQFIVKGMSSILANKDVETKDYASHPYYSQLFTWLLSELTNKNNKVSLLIMALARNAHDHVLRTFVKHLSCEDLKEIRQEKRLFQIGGTATSLLTDLIIEKEKDLLIKETEHSKSLKPLPQSSKKKM